MSRKPTIPRRWRVLALALMFACMLLFLLRLVAETAYQGPRPIAAGQINQTNLWTEEEVIGGTPSFHRGVDLPGNMGTDVRVIADGKVVQLYEMTDNNTFGNTAWGNFVVVRHFDIHWDQTKLPDPGQSFVFSIYAHLEKNSVSVGMDNDVAAGQVIARRDNTGRSTGSHLHLQVVLNSDSGALLTPTNTLDSENKPRNPELWFDPLNGTGAVIGKVTDTNGNPVENLIVCGIHKNTTGYVYSRTYSFPWANPDDILHENFGTTDVDPDTYFLYTANYSTGCGGGHVYDLGDYTFTADAITYVGLYPAWLPAVRPSTSAWDTQIFVHNHASNRPSVNYTTYYSSNSPIGQRNRTTVFQGTEILEDEPSTAYAGVVVPNQDSSVVVVARRNGQPTGYTGIVATNVKDSVIVSPGWERAGHILYVPLLKKNWVNRRSAIYVSNAGARETTVHVTYYNQAGIASSDADDDFALKPNTRHIVKISATGMADGIYSARITNDQNQPLAAVILEGEISDSDPDHWPAMYNGFSSGSTTLYGPLVKKNYTGNTTGITLQNTVSTPATFTATYYDMNGAAQGVVTCDASTSCSIPGYSPYVLYNPTNIPDGFLGSVRITSNKALAGQMSEGNGSGGLRLMSNLALSGSRTIYLPLWYDNYTTGGSWMSGVNVQNAHSAGQNITAKWYLQDGTLKLTQTASLVNSRDTHNFYETSLTGFVGSVVITSSAGPIVAVSNVRDWSVVGDTDTTFAFNGSNR